MYKNAAVSIAKAMNKYLKYGGVEKIKLEFGMEIVLNNISKMFILGLIAYGLGVVAESIIIFIVFRGMRKYAHGLHAKSSINCLIYSGASILLVPIIISDYCLNSIMILILGIIVILLYRFYAPSDTQKNPLVNKKLRKGLKKKAIIWATIFVVIAIVIPNEQLKVFIIYGLYLEVVSILPITYKILKHRKDNYEWFTKECNV